MANYLASDDPAAPNKVFASLSPFSEQQCVELEIKRPGHLMALALAISEGDVDTRLRKRYAVPFATPNAKVKRWVAAILTPEAYDALGVRPSDEIQERIAERYKLAIEELKEAADAEKGLFDLPLRSDATESAIVAPVTLGYSEQSPYTSRHKQFDAVQGNRRYG